MIQLEQPMQTITRIINISLLIVLSFSGIIWGQIPSDKVDATLADIYNLKHKIILHRQIDTINVKAGKVLEIKKFAVKSPRGKTGERLKVLPSVAEFWGINLNQEEPKINAIIQYRRNISNIKIKGVSIRNIDSIHASVRFPLSKLQELVDNNEVIHIGLSPFVKINDAGLIKRTVKLKQTKTGGIFGRAEFSNRVKITSIEITLLEDKKFIKHDKEGYFYIDNLNPGIYNLKIRANGEIDYYIENINVNSDSVSCLQFYYLDQYPDAKISWSSYQQKKTDPISYGKIEGYAIDDYGNALANTPILCLGSYWGTETDSLGFFRINKVIPGHYNDIYIHSYIDGMCEPKVECNVLPGCISKIEIRLYSCFQNKAILN